MNQEDKWTKLTIDRETLAKLGNLAEKHYRSVPGEIRFLVDREMDNLDPEVSESIGVGEKVK